MKQKLYSIFDKATGAYAAPFTQPTNAGAIRAIKMDMENENSMLGKHSGDYELWFVGEFDTDTGQITSTIERVVWLGSLKEQQ